MECSRTSTRFEAYHVQLRLAMRAGLPAVGLPLMSDDRRRRWTDRLLVMAALLTAWHSGDTCREAFAAARETVIAMYPTRRRPGRHLEGFLKALRTRSAVLLTALVDALRRRTQRLTAAQWRWKGWVVLGVDGSRINCPRSAANQRAFGCAGKCKTAPQQLLVTLFHVFSGLPWGWRRDRGDAGERGLLRAQLGDLPPHTLLLADAGFTGYELLRDLSAAGHAFVVRAGRNVRLLRQLGFAVRERGSCVYVWPQERRDQPPLVLRLVSLHDGRRGVALLTNVLDEQTLSDADLAALYRRRWTIEVMYRSLKQTLGKRTLRGDTPRTAEIELDWAMAGLWLLGLMAVQQAGLRRAWSPACTLRAVRFAMRRARHRGGARRLAQMLCRAVYDNYRRLRPKTARDWPHKKTESPPGLPHIRIATPAEVALAQLLIQKTHAA